MRYSRADYMAGRCDFDTYYGQICSEDIIHDVIYFMGAHRILQSKDPKHFNDIPLDEWDLCGDMLAITWPKGDRETSAGLVCVAKRAARIFRDDYENMRLTITKKVLN